MKSLPILLLKFVLCSAALHSTCSADTLIDFNELSVFTPGDGSTFFDGYGANANGNHWTSQGVSFSTSGPFNGGWSYSNVDNITTPGFGNQFAAITGSDFDGVGNYALAYESIFTGERPVVTLGGPSIINSVQVTNTTYAALSMRNGDSFTDPFGGADDNVPDFLRLTFTGSHRGVETGTVEFFLGDYRFADNSLDFIVDEWTEVNLTGLGVIDSLSLSFDGSQNDPIFGLNSPAYAAFDNFSITSVPEPSSMVALCTLTVAATAYRRRKQRVCKHPSLGT